MIQNFKVHSEEDFFDNGEEEVLNFYKMSRKLKQDTHNIYARLQSIKEDSNFVSYVFKIYSLVPKFANLRCGLWYHHSFDSTCYFKSTDGHSYHWQFSLNRLNLHVLKTALKKECLMIVDSTRKGKLFPDSFSKTIPIWCCVMNKVLSYLKFGEKKSNLKLPTWVHDTEKIQIEERLESWVDFVLNSGLDLKEFIEMYTKPLQCVWISRRTELENTSKFSLEGLDFIPIILVSASDPDHPIKTTSWVYIQGAGDDHDIELSRGKCVFLIDSKKHKRGLEEVLGEILYFIEQELEKEMNVYVLGRTGKNEEIVVGLAAMCSLFDSDNNFEKNKQNRDYTRQHLCDKQMIRKKLMYIQSFINDASPSRSMMKSLNRHLLS
ncbi:initiator tRNA phosphoribosyl-transferase [Naegleria gruberi]|uniref:Initiator tRNA phosphoribosyl-transferase n=1 Tax=Naegleria gruberi TaxID=5762 RepID=D2V938_NAEGR|nr:initiator tRNA phosphoribosyl-transferase [Naegleria gruberi]EFC46523.1 initiator tRNA phosphoribosyl-transferase [Naegleria gruberi]|eukprot:XP_002679267.1 initiator tRNA phosphoribosyl-transferase [Naegleria gruberi strain NEG-M]